MPNRFSGAADRAMASALKKVVIALGIVVLIGVLGFTALIVIVVRGDNAAKAKATALCDGTAVGSSTQAVLERARTAGSVSRDPQWHGVGEGSEELVLTFPAALPLTGYLCSITARDGVVTAAQVSVVD
jgi:hypothetical protein